MERCSKPRLHGEIRKALLVNFIRTWYYDDFIVICRKADEEKAASDFEILGCHFCVHSQVYSLYFPDVWGIRNPHSAGLSTPSVFDLSTRVATQISSQQVPRIHCIWSNHCFCPSTIPECQFPAAFANISEGSGSFCLQWSWVLAASRGAQHKVEGSCLPPHFRSILYSWGDTDEVLHLFSFPCLHFVFAVWGFDYVWFHIPYISIYDYKMHIHFAVSSTPV